MNLRELVLHYLRVLQERGCARLPLDEEARGVLRRWMLEARRGKAHDASPKNPPSAAGRASSVSGTPFAEGAAAPAKGPLSAEGTPSAESLSPVAPLSPGEGNLPAETESAPPQTQPPPIRLRFPEEENPSSPTADDAADAGAEIPEIPFFRPGGSTPEEVWQNFERLLPRWKPLRELGTLRPTAVPGQGNRHADILFVGDAPNYYDEKEQAPFRGEAGGKLDGMLRAMGLSRESVYITHLVKFRPALPRQTLNNRPPNEKEILYSSSILELEIRLIRPKVIVALGVIAARGILKKGALPLAEYQQMRGTCHDIPVVVTHHPSYLLRTSDLQERRQLWEEMLRVMELAHLPITDKQRGYFLPRKS